MIDVRIDAYSATLTIDRQEKANSLTEAMLRDLTGHLDDLAGRDDIRAVILTGAGRVFSAGADLDEAKAGLAKSPEWERLSARMATMPCLTIAALNGTLAGGAFGMVLACDLRIAVPEARFFYPVMKLGFLPQPSDPRRLTQLIGAARAKMILMAGARIEAREALAWGLVERLVPAQGLMAAAQELAGDCLAADGGHVMAIKAMIGQRP
ncbi:Enoyl-CoA hydratase/carnithine racemase [Paracoccus alcaliphilus]|uniref:Enoyl-CoA hydratase/carnithine racemase n=1 Tax=Paracoccus alcaliphilus TaxID=34002 RepID=A0A1H8GP32_9RHOB|nr:enoyl-CoA hydratase/isomerase family protein [Paracoccus alcaliphilus]WCR18826.1 enoyl-CoA hydratase/isomerase family protein [Paracoccus alcaliphilus]SEN45743.1 Enoyl-CoA hydratase/carnithine racemase [Paracoccus alcaliphilus]